MKDYINYGIIGAGRGAGSGWSFHNMGSKRSKKYKFTAAYDINEKNLELVLRTHKEMKGFTNLDDFFKSDIDAVLIMVPHAFHDELVVKAAQAGKHVLCEKPMATTLEGCDRMINATQKAGVKFMIAENHRFLPAHQYIHDAIQKGMIGKPLLIRAYEGVDEITGLMKEGYWKGHPIKAGGGSLMDMGAHKYATLNWILGEKITSVYAWITKQCITLEEKAEDNALTLIKYPSGIVGEVTVSFTQKSLPTNILEIYGTKGTILENHMWAKPVKMLSLVGKASDWIEPEIEHAPFPGYYPISFSAEDEYFASCILENRTPEFTPQQARDAISGVLMGYLSAETGKTATIDDLMAIYQSKGTLSILEDLPKAVQKNYSNQ